MRFDLLMRNMKRWVYVGAALIGVAGFAVAEVLRDLLQSWVNGLSGVGQAVFVVTALVVVAAAIAVGFVWDRRSRRRLESLDPVIQRLYWAEKDREHRRNLRFLPFYTVGALVTVGIMIALALSVAYWWLVGLALVLVWILGARPLWFGWVEPWRERATPSAARLR